MISIVLALAILGMGGFFLMLFFQFQRIETKLDEALKDVEVFMLKEFGEINQSALANEREK